MLPKWILPVVLLKLSAPSYAAGLILGLRPANEKRRYAVSHWVSANLGWDLCRIYASVNRINIGSDNGLTPIRRQAIILNNNVLMTIAP